MFCRKGGGNNCILLQYALESQQISVYQFSYIRLVSVYRVIITATVHTNRRSLFLYS
jgi:hypothetical protein